MAVLPAATLMGPSAADTKAPQPPATVVIELFTSQGCSSCPPADRLLTRLAAETQVEGAKIIPLAFHVDYWNHIGWQDPFSSEEWSRRQRAYATALGLETIYTPQLFLNGRRQIVGADERELRREIRAVQRTPASIGLTLAIDPATVSRGDLRVRTTATTLTDAATPRLLTLLVVFQDGLVTPVGSGENARQTLLNDRVVRGLQTLFELGPGAAREAEKVVDLGLDPAWPREHLGIAVVAQDPETLAIHGAEVVRLSDVE